MRLIDADALYEKINTIYMNEYDMEAPPLLDYFYTEVLIPKLKNAPTIAASDTRSIDPRPNRVRLIPMCEMYRRD